MQDTELFSYDTIQKFNETEIMLYKYVLENTEKIPYMTIREFAVAVNLSTSSILRFCTKLGCEGYNDFKHRFKNYMDECTNVLPGSDLGELLHYFQGTNTSVFEKKIQEGVKLIQKAEMIIFIGLGSSGALARRI